MRPYLLKPWVSIAYFAGTYRRTWKSSVLSSFIAPLAYLFGIGFGVGSIVSPGDAAGYASQLFPGLVVLAAVSTAAAEGTFPVFSRAARSGYYQAMKYAPLRISEIVLGQLYWIVLRAAASCAVFGAVALSIGVATTHAAVAAGFVATAGGVVAALPLMAFSVTLRREGSLELGMRLVYTPIVLFSGALYPIAAAPLGYQVVAWFNPVWHAVAIADAVAGMTYVDWTTLAAHIGILGTVGLFCFLLSLRNYDRRLRT